MTKDGGSFTYTFDDEGHLTIASGMTNGPYCYVYDGNGLRVAKKSNSNSTCSTGTVVKLYWRSLAGDALAETDGSGNTINEYVFFAGRRVASRNSSGNVFYWFADQLGSTRTITDANGNLCYDAEFTPYGQEISHTERLQTTACPPSYKFTGYERDPESTVGANDTGLDYAFARYYSSRLGRFLSTDPLGGAIGDLQSHNSYAYVVNNPMNLTDPSGLCQGGGPYSRPSACPDGDAPYPCTYAGAGFCGGGGGGGLDGGCLLNGAPAACSMVNSLLSNGSGVTALCPPTGCPQLRMNSETGEWEEWSPQSIWTTPDGTIHVRNGVWVTYNIDFYDQAYTDARGTSIIAANNGTPTTPWYKNSCITGALKSGAISVGIDALGFLPEAGGVARVVGHQAGYVGKVADNLGKNMLTAGTKTTGVLNSATGFSSSDWTTWVSAGITVADFVPVLSDFTTPVAMAWDAGVAAYKVYQCPK